MATRARVNVGQCPRASPRDSLAAAMMTSAISVPTLDIQLPASLARVERASFLSFPPRVGNFARLIMARCWRVRQCKTSERLSDTLEYDVQLLFGDGGSAFRGRAGLARRPGDANVKSAASDRRWTCACDGAWIRREDESAPARARAPPVDNACESLRRCASSHYKSEQKDAHD